MRTLVLLLAHDGVNHPDAWRRWERASGGALTVAVHCPLERARRAYVRERRLPIRFGRTAWGEASIVNETMRATEALLERYSERFLLIFASGACVPACPPSRATSLPYETRFGDGKPPSEMRAHHSAQQWFCVTREDAQVLVDSLRPGTWEHRYVFDIVCPDCIAYKDVLSDRPGGFPITRDWGLDCDSVGRVCTRRTIASACVLGWRPSATRWVNPIEWVFVDRPLSSLMIDEGTGVAGPWSLRRLMLWVRLFDSALFVRKVTRRCYLGDDLLDALFSEEDAEARAQFDSIAVKENDDVLALLEAVDLAKREHDSGRAWPEPQLLRAFLSQCNRWGLLRLWLRAFSYDRRPAMRAMLMCAQVAFFAPPLACVGLHPVYRCALALLSAYAVTILFHARLVPIIYPC